MFLKNRLIIFIIILLQSMYFDLYCQDTLQSTELDYTFEDENTILTNHAILKFDDGYMISTERTELALRIEKGIISVMEYLNTDLDTNHYISEKITYFIRSGDGISHVAGSYNQPKYWHPFVYLYNANKNRCSYLHETVHIFKWNYFSLWIREGLAINLDLLLSEYPGFPTFGKDIDSFTIDAIISINNDNNLQYKAALNLAYSLVGKNGIHYFKDLMVRKLFYLISGSFSKYLINTFGLDIFMEFYESKDTFSSIQNSTGFTVNELKENWIDSLEERFNVSINIDTLLLLN